MMLDIIFSNHLGTLQSFFNTKILFVFGCAGASLLHGGSLQVRRAGAALVAVPGPLTAVASLVMEHRLSNCGPGA